MLTELLELPSWLRLTSAWCNHISFRISWAKLKSVPITLSLDEVNISVETCEIVRTGTPTAGSGIQSLSVPMGKYSFIHKVIDGITIQVNTVNVNFKSPAFTSSVQVSIFIKSFAQPKEFVILDVENPRRIANAKMDGRGTALYETERSNSWIDSYL